MQSFLATESLINNSIEIIEKGDLFAVENMILGFLNQEILPKIYEEVFKKSFEVLKSNIEEKAKNLGYEGVRVRTRGVRVMSGVTINVPTIYAQTGSDESEGRNLTHEYLGIINGCTPFLASDVVSTGLYAPSFQVASEILATRGILMDDNKVASLTYKIAKLGQEYRGRVSFQEGESFSGKNIVIGIDGGRIRTRKQKKGRPRKGGKRGYHAERRETKSIVIAVLDENGKVEKTIKPFYDACIGTPKELFEMLALYLIYGEIGNAKHVCVVADGAKRIRDGTQEKLLELGVSAEDITEVLDYCHAVGHLGDFMAQIKTLTPKEKKKLMKRRKKLLWNGKTEALLEEMKRRCRGRNAGDMGKELRYFKNHKHRMNYSLFRENGLVCGSGIIESMIRRTTNLRLKGNGVFRTVPHAQKSLYLRSQLISGRRQVFIGNMLVLNRL